MGKKDITQMKFLRDTGHFADIWNGLAFNGKQVLRQDELEEISPVGLAIRGSQKSKKTSDMIMARTKNGEKLAILIAENQLEIDYSMIVRIHLREAMEYDKQVSEIVKRNRKSLKQNASNESYTISSAIDSLSPGEYMYSFKKSDRLKPVSTLVLYWNSNTWDGATSMYELFDFNGIEEMKNLVSDFKLNIVNINNIKEEQKLFQNQEVRNVIALYLRRNDKDAFKEYVDNYGSAINLESMEFITEMIASKELDDYINKNVLSERSKGEMCKAITELIEDGKIEGRAEGRAEGELKIELLNQLNLKLISSNRIEDLKRAAVDEAYRKGLILEFFPDRADDYK